MPESDETIITRFVVEADEAVKKAQEFRFVINEIKEQLKVLPKEAKENLAVVSKAMIDAFRTDRLKQMREELQSSLDVKGVTQKAQADIQTYSKAMTIALREVRQEETILAKETSQQAQIQSNARKEEEQIAKQAAKSIADAEKTKQQAARDAAQNIIRNNQQQAAAIKNLEDQTKQSTQGFRLFGQEIKNIGDVARVVLIGIFGVSVIQIIRNVIRGFGEAAQAGYEFAKSIFQLEVGARALQRAGVDITIQQIYEQIGLLQERFKIFTTKDLVVGTAAFLNLNRDMGFTRDQLFKLQNAIAVLAVVNGRAMDEVQRTVALALSSGYTEGLQRLGVSINRVTIANEAARLGFAKSYMALNEQQRALATYNLIIRKTAIYQDDLQKYYKTAPGAIDRTKTSFQEFKNTLGLVISTNIGIFLQGVWKQIDRISYAIAEFKKTRLGGEIQDAIRNFKEFIKNSESASVAINAFADRITKLGISIGLLLPPLGGLLITLGRLLKVGETLNKGFLSDEAVDNTIRQEQAIAGAIDKIADDVAGIQEDINNKLLGLQKDYAKDLDKITKDLQKDILDAEKDYASDLEKIDTDLYQKLSDLSEDYSRRRSELLTKFNQDVANLTAKYNLDVAQVIRDFANRRAEIERKYRLNEIIAEKRFQEELRKLREDFLLDLEDALHERDARQVLRLIRQYNLQKEQITRQNNLEKNERRLRFEEELKDLEIQKAERLRVLQEEYQARLSELRRNLEAELEAERIKFEQSKADEEAEAQRKKDARQQELIQTLTDLYVNAAAERSARKALLVEQTNEILDEYNRRLIEIGKTLAKEVELTNDGGAAVMKALNAYYGPGGLADKIFAYYVASAKIAAVQAQAALLSVFGTKIQFGQKPTKGTPPPTYYGRQMGGEVYKGSVYKVHRDETFVPSVSGRILNVKQSQEALSQSIAPIGRGEGKVKIGVSLSPDLVGEILSESMDQVADVMFELERRR